MEQSSKLVAIAEHDPDDRVLFTEAFNECSPDAVIEFFDSGTDLLNYLNKRAKYAQSVTTPSMVLMTLDIPGISAFDVIAEIKNNPKLKRIPLVVMTDSVFEEDLGACYELGANTVITKPSDYDELLKLIKSVCEFWFTVASR